eukprot:TRINITY_DN6364_c0_g1_i1.p2 TRINITY_DN6364_c0_g1~~TRINITY_DN6364_c0_g1_i1.p2  ORF type:complete len:294 (+),score=93.51 TRINITY_DN6364_c0_g1_i1:37-882(+)
MSDAPALPTDYAEPNTIVSFNESLPIPVGPDDDIQAQEPPEATVIPAMRTLSSSLLAQDAPIPMGSLDIHQACLKFDPRNGLALANVPKELAGCGGIDWGASVVYWYGFVDRTNTWWRKERRALFVSDDHIYIAHVDGHTARALPILKIKSIALSHEQRWINIIVADEHDLRFCCLEPCTGSRDGKSVPFFLGVLAKLWPPLHGGRPLPLKRLPADVDPKSVVNLESGWSWTGATIQYPRTRASLADHRILAHGVPPPPPPNAAATQTRPRTSIAQAAPAS